MKARQLTDEQTAPRSGALSTISRPTALRK